MNNPTFTTIGVERLRMNSDGKGITTLVAGYGCPLRCQWCLNPQCFKESTKTETFTVEQLIEKVSIDHLYFLATEGGITFGGGEPLLYADFIHSFRQKCPEEWKINLETSLNIESECLLKVLEDIDCFIVDIKDMNPAIYQRYTGKNNDLVVKNLSLLPKEKTIVRIPHIPDYNNDSDIQESLNQIRRIGFEQTNVFPYDKNRSLRKQK